MNNRIRSIRIDIGLTQQELAERIGTSQQQVDRWEKGQTASLIRAVDIANALDVEIEQVFPVFSRLKRRSIMVVSCG